MVDQPSMYSDLAEWWPLLSAPAEYAEEAEWFRRALALPPTTERPTLLELGSGGGNLASHLREHFTLTLCDRSRAMLEVSRRLNPGVEHVEGDMRTVRLARAFDVVLIHDAVMYCATPGDLRDALETAATHCRPGGHVIVAPDCVAESFSPGTDHGGHDAADGRGLRYLEWTHGADPEGTTFEVTYAIVVREASGEVRVALDRHVEGLFPLAAWLSHFEAAGLRARYEIDPWARHVFFAKRSSPAVL